METIWQSNVAITVNRINEREIKARCFFVSTGYEAVAQLTAAVDTFTVTAADWDIYRSPASGLNGRGEAAALVGTEAYLQAAGALKAVAAAAGELPKQLLADCVKGIIQAETYLYRERGFPTAEAYEAYWKTQYLNSCRAYSNLDRVTHSWSTHIATRGWGNCLFNRIKTAVVTRGDDGRLRISGSFTDSFHEALRRLGCCRRGDHRQRRRIPASPRSGLPGNHHPFRRLCRARRRRAVAAGNRPASRRTPRLQPPCRFTQPLDQHLPPVGGRLLKNVA